MRFTHLVKLRGFLYYKYDETTGFVYQEDTLKKASNLQYSVKELKKMNYELIPIVFDLTNT